MRLGSDRGFCCVLIKKKNSFRGGGGGGGGVGGGLSWKDGAGRRLGRKGRKKKGGAGVRGVCVTLSLHTQQNTFWRQ